MSTVASNTISDRDFKEIAELVYSHCKITLGDGKKELVQARVMKRLIATGCSTFGDYIQRLRMEEPSETRLTDRQREVLQLIAEGNSTKEIAKRLELSVKTVDTHRTQLMKQLNVHEVTGLVRYAVRAGIINLDQ